MNVWIKVMALLLTGNLQKILFFGLIGRHTLAMSLEIVAETCLCEKVRSTTEELDPSPLINLGSIPNIFYDLGCIPKYTESIPSDPKQRCNTILQTCLC